MVRFIIRWINDCGRLDKLIYIPIWLDLLLRDWHDYEIDQRNLHSNMVRFIIDNVILSIDKLLRFTFQYG